MAATSPKKALEQVEPPTPQAHEAACRIFRDAGLNAN